MHIVVRNFYLQEGLIAVSDYENKCISLFDMDGKYQTKIGSGKLLGPKGLTVTKDGNILSVDNKVSRRFFHLHIMVK